MKRHLIGAVRATGLLKQADALSLLRWRVQSFRRNRRFVRDNPDFAPPPHDLAFDAYNHTDYVHYHESGLRHAAVFARAIGDALPSLPEIAVLDWGCGPGRIIRHMRASLPGRTLTLTGTDANARSIAWCKAHLPGATFAVNGFEPPLAFAGASFDAVYSFSVLTHLSGEVQSRWTAELRRVLRPGGVLLCTTHGDCYRDKLATGGDVQRYATDGLVVQDGYEEGKKWFLTLNSPEYVRDTLLASFVDVTRLPVPPEAGLQQDLWIGRKPGG